MIRKIKNAKIIKVLEVNLLKAELKNICLIWLKMTEGKTESHLLKLSNLIFTHSKLCFATATHTLKRLKLHIIVVKVVSP